MAAPLSPSAMLATSMHAQPGVYALLLGSGVSTGAGMPTGWGVVTDLVRKVAAQEDEGSLEKAQTDPEGWWQEKHGEPLGYSSLLESLAPTAASRQGLLAGYFEPIDEERDEEIKTPSKAHRAVAQLMKKGYVKVVITTNFDRLMEQALEAEGVAPQVIARPEAVAGMEPLTHAAATVIKLHGDYKDLGSLNTPEELASYPDQWNRLIERVLDDYGLLISGWSADWDTALVALMEAAPNRRYPLYWDSRSSKGDAAQRLLAGRNGTVIPAAGADELFSEIASNVEALERLADPPLTTAMAVARLKRYLPDPVRRIDLHDLVMDATMDVAQGVIEQPLSLRGLPGERLQSVLDRHREGTLRLRRLLVQMVWHDEAGIHGRLLKDVLQRLIDVGLTRKFGVSVQGDLDKARLYPALLVQTALGVAATYRGRDDVIIELATQVIGTRDRGVRLPLPAAQIVHPWQVLDNDGVNRLPRWGTGSGWTYPISHLLKADTRDALLDLLPADQEDSEDAQYIETFHGYEYRMSLIHAVTSEGSDYLYGPMPGEYVGETGWSWDQRDVPLAEIGFRESGDLSIDWPWNDFLGGGDEPEMRLVAHREKLAQFKYH
ncbi:SIR2 family protein [Kocuria palustris]|uniref:SIR2 family protein n=1 Tax=Kocuria palustris TaxID=71999 RepID=UPI003D742DB0